MSLARGDHLRIQRNGRLIDPGQEAYHEFETEGSIVGGEVLSYTSSKHAKADDSDQRDYYDVRIRVVR